MRAPLILWLIILLAPGPAMAQTPETEWLISDSTLVDFDLDSGNNILTLSKRNIGYEIRKYDTHGSLLLTISDTFPVNDLKMIESTGRGTFMSSATGRSSTGHRRSMWARGLTKTSTFTTSRSASQNTTATEIR